MTDVSPRKLAHSLASPAVSVRSTGSMSSPAVRRILRSPAIKKTMLHSLPAFDEDHFAPCGFVPSVRIVSPKGSSELLIEFMEPVRMDAPFLLQDRGLDAKKDVFWLGVQLQDKDGVFRWETLSREASHVEELDESKTMFCLQYPKSRKYAFLKAPSHIGGSSSASDMQEAPPNWFFWYDDMIRSACEKVN